MSVEERNVIDGTAINESGQLLMLISDHLDWSNEYHHLMLLQDKINAYISFCENGQYKKVYPDMEFKSAVIEVYFEYELTKNAFQFLSNVQSKLGELGILIRCHIQ